MLKIQKTFKDNNPIIYMVTTPIGNLSDITKRAIEVLSTVDFVYCEDTRNSFILLNELGIKTNLRQLHKFNENEKVKEIYDVLNSGNNIAIISDAGVPGINDPGMLLINNLLNLDIKFSVSAIGAGPAYVHALISSGFLFDKHLYLGFLERKEVQIKKELESIYDFAKKGDAISVCFYESVHRVKKTLEVINDFFNENDVEIAICRELTKWNEEIIRLSNRDIKDLINNNDLIEKGEFCIVINFKKEVVKKNANEEEVISHAKKLIESQNMRKKEALKKLREEYEFNFEEIFKKI